MEPATHILRISEPTDVDAVLDRLQARLDQEPAPAILIRRAADAVEFTSETWGPILISRIENALEAELGPEGARRAFR